MGNLTYLPVPVDPRTTDRSIRHLIDEVILTDPGLPHTKADRIFWLFADSLHRFDDEQAKTALTRAMKYSDGIAIIELQDRQPGCMIMTLSIVLLWILLSPLQLLGCMILFLFTAILWTLTLTSIWNYLYGEQSTNRLLKWAQQLAMCIWILPALIILDDVVSCLGTREFEKVMNLAQQTHGVAIDPPIIKDNKMGSKLCNIGGWEFRFHRQQYTWPFCYVNMIFGLRKQQDLEQHLLSRTTRTTSLQQTEPNLSEASSRSKRSSRHDSTSMLALDANEVGSSSESGRDIRHSTQLDSKGILASRKSSLKFKGPGERAKDKLELDSRGNPITESQWSVKDFRHRKRRRL